VAWVRIDRNAPAIVGDGEEAVGPELDRDRLGMAGHGLVHGVVQHLGEQMMQRPLVGAADVHAGTLADRLQAFEHLDGVGTVVARLGRRRRCGVGARQGLRLLSRRGRSLALGLGRLRQVVEKIGQGGHRQR